WNSAEFIYGMIGCFAKMGKRAKKTPADGGFLRLRLLRNGTMSTGSSPGGPRMDALSTLFDVAKKSGQTEGNLLGFLHVLVGRTITKDKTAVSQGLTWRDLAG